MSTCLTFFPASARTGRPPGASSPQRRCTTGSRTRSCVRAGRGTGPQALPGAASATGMEPPRSGCPAAPVRLPGMRDCPRSWMPANVVREGECKLATLPPWYVPDVEGTDLRPDPDAITTVPGLVAAMRRYRIWAGGPSFRVLAARCRQRVSASAFCAALGSQRKLPSRELVRDFVGACGVTEEYLERFDRAWRRLAGTPPETPVRPGSGPGKTGTRPGRAGPSPAGDSPSFTRLAAKGTQDANWTRDPGCPLNRLSGHGNDSRRGDRRDRNERPACGTDSAG
jgi:hypothetical protein